MSITSKLRRRLSRTLSAIFGLAALHYGVSKYMHVETPRLSKMPENAAVLTGSKGRVKTGLQMLEKNHIKNLHISGASSPLDSILLHFNYTQNTEIYSKISIDNAQNTAENAEKIISWAQKNNIKRLGIITSKSHMRRALYCLEKAAKDQDIEFVPHCVGEEPSLGDTYQEFGAIAARSLGL